MALTEHQELMELMEHKVQQDLQVQQELQVHKEFKVFKVLKVNQVQQELCSTCVPGTWR